MAPFTLMIDPSPRAEDVQLLLDGLNGHAIARAGTPPPEPLAIFLYDEAERIVGGLQAQVWDGVLEIRLIWVHEDFRGEGYGKRLMETAEAEGIARGCELATLRTFSYQAPEFYKKLGYEEYAVVEDWPRGHSKHAFRKRLERAPVSGGDAPGGAP
jgi:ribosomal protein S18 acetylase RimI-like enzyme